MCHSCSVAATSRIPYQRASKHLFESGSSSTTWLESAYVLTDHGLCRSPAAEVKVTQYSGIDCDSDLCVYIRLQLLCLILTGLLQAMHGFRGFSQRSSSPLLVTSEPLADIINVLADFPSSLAAVAKPGEPDSGEGLATDCAAPCEAAALGSPGRPTSQDALIPRGKRWIAQQAEDETQAVVPHVNAQQQTQRAVHVSSPSVHESFHVT